ncbi:unnamed protein product [Cuscuta campestris]|uniref:Mechanosensitive ion channel protein n=1 Tax=Cuscuta campestris TaxID=132261 RepID=A0A484M4P0_9ASTE|nr:unnamed protein product [Cuscuta campestris]
MDRLSSLSSLKKQRSLGISAADADDEHRPILLGNHRRHDASPSSSNENSPVMRRSSSLIHNNNNNNPHDGERGEVIIKIDGDSNQRGGILHDNGGEEFEFQHNGCKDVVEDPPSRLIGQFLNKQRAAGGEMCLDMDMEMDELRESSSGACACSPVSFPPQEPYFSNRYNSNRISASRDLKVQFIEEHSGDSTPPNNRVVNTTPDHHQQNHSPSSSLLSSDDDNDDEEMMEPPQQQQQHNRRRTSGSMTFNFNNKNNVVEGSGGGDGHVVKCTSFQRRGSFITGRMMINKTKSRLMDDIVVVPDVVVSEKKSGKIFGKSSVQTMRSSGLMMGKSPEEEEDDPLLDDFDIPDEFKSSKIDALTLAQWISLVVIVTSLVCTLCFPSLKAYRMRGLRLWKWEVLILVLICGRLVSGWAIRVAVFFIERNFLLRKRLLYFVYGVRRAVQNCLWLGLVLIAWHSMFDKKVEGNNDFLRSVNKIMVCMLIGITLWLLKTLMVKVLASSFHVSKFFDRIQESLFNQYIIEALSGPPLNEIHNQSDVRDDLRRFLRQEEAVQAMNLLGGSRDCRRIRKASLKNWVVNVFRERRALALTLDDTKTAVKKLHQMVTVLVAVIIFLISLVILGFVTGRDLMYISSQVVIVTFIFGNQCKNVFEAIIFLFVMHPFDVGDRCEVDGVEMVVEEMNILTTVFLRYDNLKVHFPNSTLAMRPIGNFYRSPDMGDSVDFLVHIATPMDKIKVMNQRIVNFVESKKEHWYSSPMVVLMNIGDINKLKMSVWLRHRMNFQDMGERWLRRAQLVDEMVKIFKEMDIDYRLYPIDINIRAMPPTVQSTRHPPKWQPPSIPDPSA